MTELKLDYEQKMRMEGVSEMPVPPCLRTRQEVRQKLMELGLASHPSDFGRHKRQPGERRHRERDSQLEVLEGGISVMKKPQKTSRGRRRTVRGYESSPELHFDPAERLTPIKYQVRNCFVSIKHLLLAPCRSGRTLR